MEVEKIRIVLIYLIESKQDFGFRQYIHWKPEGRIKVVNEFPMLYEVENLF